MKTEADHLDYLAQLQCDLKLIQMHYVQAWDEQRILAFAKALAIRSRQVEDGWMETQARSEIERAIARSKNPLNACLSRMETGALKTLSEKVLEWRRELAQSETTPDGWRKS